MRKIWFNPNIVGNGMLWIVGIAVQIGGWVSQPIAIFLLIIAFIWSIATLGYWLRFRHKKTVITPQSNITSSKFTVGDLFAHSHKCSKCGWGIKVTMFDNIATCPKCGNTDDVGGH